MNNEENSQSQSNEDLYNEIENKANFDNLNIIEIYLPTDQVVGELHDEILRFQEINILKNNKCLEDFRTKFCPRLDQVCLESLGIKPEVDIFNFSNNYLCFRLYYSVHLPQDLHYLILILMLYLI